MRRLTLIHVRNVKIAIEGRKYLRSCGNIVAYDRILRDDKLNWYNRSVGIRLSRRMFFTAPV